MRLGEAEVKHRQEHAQAHTCAQKMQTRALRRLGVVAAAKQHRLAERFCHGAVAARDTRCVQNEQSARAGATELTEPPRPARCAYPDLVPSFVT